MLQQITGVNVRLGQQLRVRKFQDGGTAQTQCELTAGAVWTGSTCDMSGAAGHEMTNVASQTGSQFGHLSGMTGAGGTGMADYLKETYGLQDAGDYLKSFEAYDPAKEQNLKGSYQFGMEQAQTGARQKMGDVYSQARAAGAKGGGFGGAGKSLAAMKGKTLGGLEAKQEKMGKTFTSGVQGLREDYVGDWLGQVGKLSQMGAAFCKPDEEYVDDTSAGAAAGAKICKKIATP